MINCPRFLRCSASLGLLAGLVLLLSWSPPGHAGPLRVGVQGAAGRNALTGNLPEEGSWEGQFGFGGGVNLEYNATANLALSFQPSYAPRDTRQVFKDELGNVLLAREYDLSYLSLPLIVRVTSDPEGVRGFVTAGLDLGIHLDSTVSSGSESRNIDEMFNSTSIGALFGAGTLVPVGRHYISIEVRYNQGLTDMIARGEVDPDSGLDSSSESIKYRGLNLVVGFLFTLGGH